MAQMPQPPEIAAKSYLLMDITSQLLLAQKNIDVPLEPASLTKLMTAYLVFEALKAKKITFTQELSVSERAWKMPGSRMFISPDMRVPVKDLTYGMIVQSGNDATVALAEGIGGDVEKFVSMMNDKAKVLGLASTQYKNPEGLTQAGHTTTARDLSVLATRLMTDFPEYTAIYATKKYHYPGTPAANDTNRNLLLFRDPTVDGLKTGHTDAAGYCLVATAQRFFPNLVSQGAQPNAPQDKGGRRLLAIVLGTASENARANEAQKLLNWGYVGFDAIKLYDAGQAMASVKVWKGAASEVKAGPQHKVVMAVAHNNTEKISTQTLHNEQLVAPIAKGQQVGWIKVMLSGKPVKDIPLIALEDVETAGFFKRLWHAMRMLLQ